MEAQTNGITHEVKELVEVTRALSEGDFERKLEGSFEGELGEIAMYIESLRESLKVLSPRFSSSVHLIPKAGQGVAEISQQAEVSVNSILSLVDEMCVDQDTVSEMLGKAVSGDAATLDIDKLQEIASKTQTSLMSVMSFLSFQDVVRQRAEKVQEMIDMVDGKIRELLDRFRVKLSAPEGEEWEKEPGEVALTTEQDAVDQSSIDDLFK
jgi:methyl-accepting chemotaxis protein